MFSSVRSFGTLTFLGDWVISTLLLVPLVNLLVELSSSSGSFFRGEKRGGGSRAMFSSVVCQSASLVRWDGPSTPSVSISKETFFPTIFCWFRQRIESSLKATSLLGSISGSLDPIAYSRIPHRFHNRNMHFIAWGANVVLFSCGINV